MQSRLSRFHTPIGIFILILVAPWFIAPSLAPAQVQSETTTVSTAPKAFDTAQQAAEALINAAAAYDVPELMAIFGPDGKDFVASADPARSGAQLASEVDARFGVNLHRRTIERARR